MGLFSRKNKEITVNECINRSRTEPNSVLLDIRGKDDFKESHIAGSINIPLDSIERITSRIPDKDKQIFVIGSYASAPIKAVKAIRNLGYKKVFRGGCVEDHHGLMQHDW